MSTVVLAENPLPDTNVEVVGGPLAGERDMVAWPKLSPASHRIPVHSKQTCLANLIAIVVFVISPPR
jgi:hypothetical protein